MKLEILCCKSRAQGCADLRFIFGRITLFKSAHIGYQVPILDIKCLYWISSAYIGYQVPILDIKCLYWISSAHIEYQVFDTIFHTSSDLAYFFTLIVVFFFTNTEFVFLKFRFRIISKKSDKHYFL